MQEAHIHIKLKTPDFIRYNDRYWKTPFTSSGFDNNLLSFVRAGMFTVWLSFVFNPLILPANNSNLSHQEIIGTSFFNSENPCFLSFLLLLQMPQWKSSIEKAFCKFQFMMFSCCRFKYIATSATVDIVPPKRDIEEGNADQSVSSAYKWFLIYW